MTLPSIKRLAACLIARCFGTSDEERRNRILSNMDWVIKMLHQVHEDKPEATARWWDSLKEAVLDDSAAKDTKRDRSKIS